jgi:15,16-dihydrobiliverdin:ferredoxin oxidoreductase
MYCSGQPKVQQTFGSRERDAKTTRFVSLFPRLAILLLPTTPFSGIANYNICQPTSPRTNFLTMRPQHLMLLPVAAAYTVTTPSHSFLGSKIAGPQHKTNLVMDMETNVLDPLTKYQVEKTLKHIDLGERSMSLRQAEAVHGMPWKDSIDKNAQEDPLLYMPFWEWSMSFIEEHLTDLKVTPCHNGKTDFSYNVNTKKKARIVNLCASSNEYRKIRMTYYDAGDNTQVFNAVFYPDPAYNLPILGVDLLAFNRKKFLAIVDFQPLHEDETHHAASYEHILEPIKDQYESMKGRMSSKFYDETQFFSQQMLFARFDDENIVEKDLFPAFKSYVKTHLDLVRSIEANPTDVKKVLERQKEYDTYSAERDPATGLFTAMYGAEWAGDFVHDFLFSMSERKEGGAAPAMPFMGGPPGAGGPHAAAGRPPAVSNQTHRP